METHSLLCHRDTPPLMVAGIDVSISRGFLRWSVRGASALVMPAPTPDCARSDGLWQHTCFEMFLMDAGGAYREFNFSPSGHWAAYGFDGYRSGMANLTVDAPTIAIKPDGDEVIATVHFSPSVMDGATRISLTAVVEEVGGHKSYWALAHGEGRPDFHAPSCFVLPVGAAGAV